MRASLTSRMLSMLSTASDRSILEMISGSRPSSRKVLSGGGDVLILGDHGQGNEIGILLGGELQRRSGLLAVEGLRWGPAGRRDSSLLRHPAARSHPATDGLAVYGNHL